MNEIRLADFITEYLYDIGVKDVFMLSGTGSIHLDDAFAHQKGMNYTCARHEAAAVMMAMASAKLTGEIGVVIATTGPGGTNAIGGVTEAWVDSIPVLVISGQVYTKQISKGIRSFGVQGFNIIENVINITKYAAQVTNPLEIRYHLERAVYEAKSDRPGPVWLDIPFDIQREKINRKDLISFSTPKISIINGQNEKIINVVHALENANNPVIVFGQGIRNAHAIHEFKILLEKLKIPSIAARMAIDILPHSNPYYFGLGGMRGQLVPAKILKECDLILALGTSFTHAFAGQDYDEYNSDATLIMVNIDNNEMNKENLRVDIPIRMDLKEFLINIFDYFKDYRLTNAKQSWLIKCNELKSNLRTPSIKSNPINSYYFIECSNKYSKSNHIFVNDAGSANYICSQGLELKNGQRELTSGAFYSMGVAVPLAIGASIADSRAQIIAITGDGSIELNIQELRTIAINNLNIKLFIINNGGYASIRKSQDDMVGGRYTDDIEILNFSKIASAFELPFYIIDDHNKLDSLIPQVLSNNNPALIEVVCDPNQEIFEVFKEM